MTDVPYEMTVRGAFVYVCERDRIKDCVYIMQSVITQVFSRGPDDPVIMELQCILKQTPYATRILAYIFLFFYLSKYF